MARMDTCVELLYSGQKYQLVPNYSTQPASHDRSARSWKRAQFVLIAVIKMDKTIANQKAVFF